VHFAAYLTHHDFNPWPLDPKIWRIHPFPKVCWWWKFGRIPSSNTHDILLTMFVWDSCRNTHMHGCTNTLETWCLQPLRWQRH